MFSILWILGDIHGRPLCAERRRAVIKLRSQNYTGEQWKTFHRLFPLGFAAENSFDHKGGSCKHYETKNQLTRCLPEGTTEHINDVKVVSRYKLGFISIVI